MLPREGQEFEGGSDRNRTCRDSALRPTMKFVAIKTVDQLDLQALHRIRERLVCQRTSVINQNRAFLLERGIAVRQGLRALRTEMPIVLAMTDKLSPRMIHMIETLCTDWRHLDGRIETVSDEIKTLSEQDDGAKRLITVPGIGPIISTATVAAIGSGDAFSKGRDFGAWLGLVPRQMSTGGRTVLGASPIEKAKPRQNTHRGFFRAAYEGGWRTRHYDTYVGALGRACQIKFWGPVAANPSPARANLGRTTPPIHPSVSLRQGQR